MSRDLRGLAAAITGASAGIGKACAEQCAARGISVALAARRSDRLADLGDAIRARGGQAIEVVSDVTSEDSVTSLIERTLAVFGRLDIVICNAGIGYHGTLEETDSGIMRRLMDVNFMGTFYAARAALPLFRRQRHGHIIIVSSIVGKRGIGYSSAYSATKFAQVGLAESLRAEVAGTDIHVSVVFPVSTETEFLDAMRRDFGHAVTGRGPRQSADAVACAVVRCLEAPRPEVYPYRRARGLVVFNALAPATCDRFVRRFGRNRTVEG